MPLSLVQDSEPSTPPAGEISIFLGTDGALKGKKPDGSIVTLSGDSIARNALTNGSFIFAQRQTPGTLTTYSNTSGRSYGPDRWAISNENASVQFRRVDSIAASESGLGSRYYAELKKITNAGKLAFSQTIEAVDTAPYRGRVVRVQFKAKNSVGSHTLRFALLYLNSSGTADSIPATFISAWGASGVDPTWGTNLVAIVPSGGSSLSAVSGSGLTSTLNSSWRQYGGTFTVPASAQNLIAVAFTDGQMAANDIVQLSEFGLFDGPDERPSIPTDVHDELERCQRFYWKTFDIDVAPVQNIGSPSGCARWIASTGTTGNQRSPAFNYPVRMRAIPASPVSYNPAAANTQVRDTNASGDCTNIAFQAVTDRSYAFNCNGNASTAIGNVLAVHAAFDAEL
jgi:hypothetical protein